MKYQNKLKIQSLVKFTLVWISQNLAIPFWMLGHVHLSLNIYQDVYEIIASCGMNIVVLIGFIIDYKQNNKDENTLNRTERPNSMVDQKQYWFF